MKLRIFSVITALAMVAALSFSAEAQYMTQDVVFVKAGYIPTYTVTFEEKNSKDYELNGFAAQGEYNLNFSGFWLGFGLEYQYITLKASESGEKDTHHSFLLPMASIKIAAVGGLYVGGGLAGKYLIATEASNGYKTKKDIDLWANGILGYHFPVGEGVFLDLEGRFGWNLTNRQFSKSEPASPVDIKVKNGYDIAFYAGIGFRAIGSNY